MLNLRANFCNLREGSGPVFDDQGRLIKGKGLLYDPALPGVWMHDRARFDRWIDIHRANGTTHFVIGPFEGGEIYPGSEFSNPDMRADLGLFRAFIEELVTTPMADGKGARLVLEMDGGAAEIIERIHRYWKPQLDAIREFLPSCAISPGWELIRASDCTSYEFSYAAQWLGDYRRALQREFGLTFVMVAHKSPGRAAFSSNPVERDDPWQGDEPGCWLSHGGEEFDVEGFQFIPPGDDAAGCVVDFVDNGVQLVCRQHGKECWLDRGWDSLYRLGAGNRGWRRVERWWALEVMAIRAWHEGKGMTAARSDASKVPVSPESGKPLYVPAYVPGGPHARRLGAALEQTHAQFVGRTVSAGARSADSRPFATVAADVIKTQLADRLGLSIGYGNGLPSQEAQ